MSGLVIIDTHVRISFHVGLSIDPRFGTPAA